MSLKAFHVFFILCSMFLAGSLGIWQLNFFGQTRDLLALLWAVAGLIAAAGLGVYLMWFLKKMKTGEQK